MKEETKTKMQSIAIPLLCSVVLLLMFSRLPRATSSEAVNSSCGEYFGDFPQQINANRRWGQEEVAVINYNESQVQEVFTVNLALLLPSKDGEGCDECVLRPVLPVIELAILRSQAMLNDFLVDRNQTLIRFRRMYGDTKCSSTVGPLVAVEMVNKAKPGKSTEFSSI